MPLFFQLALTMILALPSTHAFLGSVSPRRFEWDSVKYVYAFGDSYSFVQGEQGHANFSFIGDALNPAFTPQQLLSNQIVPKNTSSDGSNWLEFLTSCTEGLPALCSKQLWNFAFAGADIDNSVLPLHHDYTIDLTGQVEQWATYASQVVPHPANETLTAWWIGINDTGDTVNNDTIPDFPTFWETEMTAYFNSVQFAVDTGLRGAHLFLNVPPEDRSPNTVHNSTKAVLQKKHIDSFNGVLERHVKLFADANRDIEVISFDAHAWFTRVLDAPANFGFTNTTGFCTCTDPGYFWYNAGHITEHVHRELAEAIKGQLRAHIY